MGMGGENLGFPRKLSEGQEEWLRWRRDEGAERRMPVTDYLPGLITKATIPSSRLTPITGQLKVE